MSTLKNLSEVSFDELPLTEKLAYLKHGLTTDVPAFHQTEPVLKKNRLFDSLANRPVRCWILTALILSVLIWALKLVNSISDIVAILLWGVVFLLLVVYFICKKKVDGLFIRWNDKIMKKFNLEYENKLEAYQADLAKHQEELGEYNARELTYEQAARTVEQAIHAHGVRFCRTLLGVDETELIALHYIKSPNLKKASRKYGDHEVYASFQVQYICMTDTELYEMNGEIELFSEEFTDYSTSRILYSKIKNSDERHNNYNCLNFFAVTTSNNDGSESDVMYIPSGNLRPQVNYYIQSVTWAALSKTAPGYNQIQTARSTASRYTKTPLSYDQFEEAVKNMKNLKCINYESKKEMTETETDVENFKTVKLVVERAINRKMRESTM